MVPVLYNLVKGLFMGARAYKDRREWGAVVVKGAVLEPSRLPSVWKVGHSTMEFQRGGRKVRKCDLLLENGRVMKVHAYVVGEALVVWVGE